MADAQLASLNFELGFQSDSPRQELPRGVAYRMKDWIPSNGAPLRKRGGWTRASRDLNAVSAMTRVESLAWVPFPLLNHLIAITDNGKLFKIRQFDGANVANAGLLVSSVERTNPRHAPFYHGSATPLAIIPDSLLNSQGGSPGNVRKYYDSGGGAYATVDLGGTPPQFTCGASWGDYVVGANGFIGGTRYPNRAWFSDPGLPETWNPTASYVDFQEEILAVVPRNRMLMFFSNGGVHVLTGTTPPPGGDFTKRDFFFRQGTPDARSIAQYRDYTIWANNVGVWRSDGTSLTDLTEVGGISLYWQSLMSTYDNFLGSALAAGVYRGYYFISITASNGAPLTTLVCDLDRNVWFEMSNLGAVQFATRQAAVSTSVAKGFEEMFIAGLNASSGGKFVNNASPMWAPGSTNSADADGIAVHPVLETPFFRQGGVGLKRFRRGYLTYMSTDAPSLSTIQISYIKEPEATVYTSLAALPSQNTMNRKPFPIGKQALGIGLKIAHNGAAYDAMLSSVEFDGHAYEGSR